MPKVSVVIPIYGVEKFIERCTRCLFKQTLDDIEYIFVDDCTKDRSIDILKDVIKDYPNRHSQIKILRHEHNKGLPQARKTGIMEASGQYIAHCDSDDWPDLAMYEIMYNKAIEEDSDVVVCDYYLHNGKSVLKTNVGCRTTNVESARTEFMVNGRWSVWNKLFRRSLYSEDIFYPEGNMGEDLALTFQLLLRCNKVSYVDTPLYYYFQNPTSISNVKTKSSILKKYYQLCDNMAIMFKEYERLGLLSNINDVSLHMKWDVRRLIWGLTYEREYYELWKNTYPEIDKVILFSPYVSQDDKIRYILTRLRLFPFKKDRVVL